jgi:hypothetical protein
MRSVSKVQQEDKLDGIIPHSIEMKAKLCIVVLKNYGNNLVQEKDNDANGVDEMASILWNIIVSEKASIFGKWQMRHKLMILDWSQ